MNRLTNADADITDQYAYDAYGALISHDRTTNSVDQPYQYVGQLGYYTHWMEAEFGLLQLGVRFYDAEVGRFTQRDPARQGLSYYGFVGGNPIDRVDPTGLVWEWHDWWDVYFGNDGGLDLDLNRWAPELIQGISMLGSVRRMIREVGNKREREAPRKARQACARAKGRRAFDKWSVSGTRSMDITLSNFIIGGTVFKIRGSCVLIADCCRRTFQYSCGVTFSLSDRFEDAADPFHLSRGNQEFRGGVAYSFHGWWMETFGGEGRF